METTSLAPLASLTYAPLRPSLSVGQSAILAIQSSEAKMAALEAEADSLLVVINDAFPHAKAFWKFIKCRKPTCSRCQGEKGGHGPYLYGSRREGKKIKTIYYGKKSPDGICRSDWQRLRHKEDALRAKRKKIMADMDRAFVLLKSNSPLPDYLPDLAN